MTLLNRIKHGIRFSSGEKPLAQADVLRNFMRRGMWCIDHLDWDGSTLEIRGWTAFPGSLPTFAVNGIRFDEIAIGLDRADLADILWFLPGARQAGFRCRTAIDADRLFLNGEARFDCLRADSGQPFRSESTYHYPDPTRDVLPFPSPERRIRVHGSASASSFLCEGYTSVVKLRRALQTIVSKDWTDFPNILDWGCGCGRLMRHLVGVVPTRLTGVDIDRDNVGWCDASIPSASFATVPLRPPTALPANHFNLVIGLSVFTHLTEGDQDLWLDELARITAPEALLLLTSHGEVSVALSRWPVDILRRWLRDGFVCGPSDALGEVVDDKAYYQNSYHSIEYVRRRWTRYFAVEAVVESLIGNAQDLIVLRKRRVV